MTLKADLREQAHELASRPYRTMFSRDETTDGKPIILASRPELPGCMAHGKTVDEAAAGLIVSTEGYILGLLEDGVEVPEPIMSATAINGISNIVITHDAGGTSSPDIDGDLEKVIQPSTRDSMGSGVLVRVSAGY